MTAATAQRTGTLGLRSAAVAYAGAAAAASAVAVRENLPGRPLGVGLPLSVPAALAVGWGAGIAPPWPMAVGAVAAAVAGGPQGRRVMRLIGVVNLAGHLVEPVTWGWRDLSSSTRVATTAMVGAAVLLVVAAGRPAVTPSNGRG